MAAPNVTLNEDVLLYLPSRPVTNIGKRNTLPVGEAGFYLVIQGRLKVCSPTAVDDIYFEDEFFYGSTGSTATAIDDCSIMHWPQREFSSMIENCPVLGAMLVVMMAARDQRRLRRISALSSLPLTARLIWALKDFASRGGYAIKGNSVELEALTHETISEYLGTSREIVTSTLNSLRRRGLMTYGRNKITLHLGAILNAYPEVE